MSTVEFTLRLVLGSASRSVVSALAPELAKPLAERPGVLISYVYLANLNLLRERGIGYRDWVLDSGAYSAFNSGKQIRLSDYIAEARHRLATDPTLSEVFALDVINDPNQSLRNCEQMWQAGVKAIPCYHIGEPEAALMEIASNYPKIALGGMATLRGSTKLKWAEQCFARVWPKKIHGFGLSGDKEVLSLPWHSVDAATWIMNAQAFGRYRAFRNAKLSLRSPADGSGIELRGELAYYRQLEIKARGKWQKILQETQQ